MYPLRLIILLLILYIPFYSFGQNELTGKVIEIAENGAALPMASIRWNNTNLSTMSDENGNFIIALPDSLPAKLIVSMIGYLNDTILFESFSKMHIQVSLEANASLLNEIKIIRKKHSIGNLTTTTLNTELVSSKELVSAACCNISESFERNASVDVNFTDAVSGTKQIQMLGLDGIYTQILYENLPFVQGLSASHGLTYIPGPWVESIYVTKGTGSVVNGAESITGQIQIEMLEPQKADRLFINGYVNSESRLELNTHFAKKFTDNFGTILFAHASNNNLYPNPFIDKNRDEFMDMPMTEQYNLFNRWHYQIKNKLEGQVGIRFFTENKMGGQIIPENTYDSSLDYYRIGIATKQFETFTKNGFLFEGKPWKSVAIMTTERYHEQTSNFGNKHYAGIQKSLYVNTISQGIIGTTFHKIKYGLSLKMDEFNEHFNNNIHITSDSIFNSNNLLPGGYTEYTYNNDSNITLVAGIREDYDKTLGWVASPRLHIKFIPTKETILRLSGGRGIRTANIFIENAPLFASSRNIIIKESLLPEIAWNYGATFTYCWKKAPLLGKDISFNIDYFITEFSNQVVVNLEDPRKIEFDNLKGLSYSNALQTDLNFSPFEHIEVKLAYKYYEVKSTYSGKLLDKPLVPKNRALINIDYTAPSEKWKINFNAKWFGKSRLPSTNGNPVEFKLPDQSSPYFTFMAQVTKRFRLFEFYIGGENLLNYKIPNPIIDAANPFGTNFDASLIWGPISGRMIYTGFRYKII
ncbi:MAG TPA: TonB-dependent receptor [Bacteroidia bacterium]|nr:TonB-dependent receptor [Bacteroidia bacterium]